MSNIYLSLLIGTAIFFSGCNATKNTATSTNQSTMEASKNITGKKWKLTELRSKPVAETINGKMPFIQFLDSAMRYYASAGCNGLGGTYTLTGDGKIKFSQGMSTMMACENMEVENEFTKVLEQADNYIVTGDVLSLNKGKMAPLARFQEVKEIAGQDLNGTWELDYISGPRIAFEGLYPDKKPVITFNLPETRAHGNGSCNNFNLTFTIDGSNIKFNDPAATRMTCPGDGETTFFKILNTVTKYSVNQNTLNLIMGDIAVMRFQKK